MRLEIRGADYCVLEPVHVVSETLSCVLVLPRSKNQDEDRYTVVCTDYAYGNYALRQLDYGLQILT